MTLNDLEGQRSLSQNDLDNIKVKCVKFEVSTFVSFEVIYNKSRKWRDRDFLEEMTWRREWVSDGQSELYRSFASNNILYLQEVEEKLDLKSWTIYQ